jgi:hypothetical protein
MITGEAPLPAAGSLTAWRIEHEAKLIHRSLVVIRMMNYYELVMIGKLIAMYAKFRMK